MRKLDVLEDVVFNCHLEHKELLDGSGIPRGLKGTEISLHGRLAALVHAFCEYTRRPESQGQDKSRVADCLVQARNKYDTMLSSKLQEIAPQVQTAPELSVFAVIGPGTVFFRHHDPVQVYAPVPEAGL